MRSFNAKFLSLEKYTESAEGSNWMTGFFPFSSVIIKSQEIDN